LDKKFGFILVLLIIIVGVTGCDDFINFTNTYNIGGNVIDEAGYGIEDVRIRTNTSNQTVNTNEKGEWNLTGISGDAKVFVAKEGYEFEPAEYEVSEREYNISFLGIRDEEVVDDLDYSISGNVSDKEGDSINGVKIEFIDPAGNVIETEYTGTDGSYEVSGFEGEITVRPDKEDYDFEPAERTVQGERDNIDFIGEYLRYDVSGVVTDNQGEGVSGVEISFIGDDSYSDVTTNIDGEFSKSGLKGEVELTPEKADYSFSPANETVTGERDNISFIAIEDSYSISGEILDDDGESLNNVRLEFESDNYDYGAVYTDDDGNFEKDGLSGIVEVIPERPGYDFNPESISVSAENTNVDFVGYLREGDYEVYEVSGEIKTNDSEGVPHIKINFYHNYNSATRTGELLGTAISDSDDEAASWSKENLWGKVTIVPYGNQDLNTDDFIPEYIEITDEESGVDFLLER